MTALGHLHAKFKVNGGLNNMNTSNLIAIIVLCGSLCIFAENPQQVKTVLASLVSQKANLQASQRDNRSCVCTNCDFSHGSSFKGKDLKGCIFENCDFTGANLEGTIFIGARIPNCKFDHIKGKGADFSSATADKLLLQPGAKPQPPAGNWITFVGADLRAAKFVNVNFRYADFSLADLSKANFFYANIKFSNFMNSNIADTIFKATLMNDVKFTKSNAYDDKKRYTFDQALQDELFYSAGMAAPMVFCCTEMPDGTVLSMYSTWCQAPDVERCKNKYKIKDVRLPKWFVVITDER